MLIDGLQLIEGSDIANAVVDTGTAFPSNPNAGELFYRTDTTSLYVHNGTDWVQVGLTSAQLDGQSGSYYLDNANATGIMAIANGGTGASTAATARTALGLVIGTDVQAFDADLTAIGALVGTSGFLKKTAANTWSLDTASYLNKTGDTFTGTLTMTGSIIPSANITYDLGSPSMMWRDIYVGPGSIYMNGQKILENVASTIIFSADDNQNVRIETGGTGTLELQTGLTGTIAVKSTMTITSGKKILDSSGIQVEFGDNIEMGLNKITGLGTPTNNTDAATKVYVDTLTTNDTSIVRTTGAQTLAGIKTFTNDAVFSGSLTVNGQVMLQDNLIEFNSDFTAGVPTEDAGFQVRRGDLGIVKFFWDETNDRFTMQDGSNNFLNLYTTGTISAATFAGNATTATALATGRTIAMTGDVAWTSASFTGAGNVTGTSTLATVNSNVGSFGSSVAIPVLTVNAKGLVTAVSTAAITTSFTITGDVTGTIDGGTDVLTLATVNSNVGSFGSATAVPAITVNAKGLVTGVTATTIAIPTSAVTSGTFADARIAASNVTQHQASLTIAESQITDGALLARLAANETVAGTWTFSNPVTVGTPTAAGHAATKLYVDNAAQGLQSKPAARAATTAPLTATYNNGTAGVGATLTGTGALPAIDTVTLSVNDGVLVKNQASALQNGRYVVTTLSPNWVLTRCGLCDQSSEIPGAYVFITDGTLANTGWVQGVDNPGTFVVGTDAITVTQFSGAGSYTASTGLTLTGSAFSITNVGTAGTYRSVTTNAQGQVTAGTNPTTLAGYGITDAVLKTGDTMTGPLIVRSGDEAGGNLFSTQNANASNATQVFASHTLANVNFGNARAGNLVLWTAGAARVTIDSAGDATFGQRVITSVVQRITAGALTINSSDVAGSLDFRTGGASRMTIDAGGSVSVAGANLYVRGSGNLLLQHDGTHAYIRPANAGANLYLGVQATNVVTILSTGVSVAGTLFSSGNLTAPVITTNHTTTGTGYNTLRNGGASNTGYLEFIAANGNRQGYIGNGNTTGATDTGLIQYIAGTHAFTGTITGSLTGSVTGNASTATTLQTARTIALSGGATGTATSFNGSANITIPVTSLNAANLSGVVPNASISGVYSNFTQITSTGSIFSGSEFVDYSGSVALRMKNAGDASGIATLLYSDASDFYMLMTASGAADGTWNGLRPLIVNKSTGNVTMQHNLGVGGTITGSLTGNVTGNVTGSAGSVAWSGVSGKPVIGDWSTVGSIANVVGLLSWKNYGNGHVIFDASQSTSPAGGAVSNSVPTNAWSATYPTLMGWNGSQTYGVKVNRADLADLATNATNATNATFATSAGGTTKLSGNTNGLANVNTALSLTVTDAYFQTYSVTATNKPVSVDNANGLLSFVTHPTGGSGSYGRQFAFPNNDDIYTRSINNGTQNAWRIMLHSGNYSSYSPTLTGTGASGTWGINISGSASQVGGFGVSVSQSANTVMVRDGSGHGYVNHLNQASPNSENAGVSQVMITNGADNFLRKASISHLTSNLSGTAPISITGNAATLGGLAIHAATNNEVNKIVRTDSNGYANFGWINTTSGDNGTTAPDRVYASNDGYLRYYTLTNFRTVMGLPHLTGTNTFTGANYFQSNFDTGAGTSAPLQAYSSNGSGAVMSFHRAGQYAVNMGLDSDNVFRIGGWSAGANRLQLNMNGQLTTASHMHPGGNVYTDDNYGFGLVGLYDASRYQGVFAMGDAYKLSADGTTPGSLYGIAWTHENVGGQSKPGLSHQALFMTNGVTQTAIGTGIWTAGAITTTNSITATGILTAGAIYATSGEVYTPGGLRIQNGNPTITLQDTDGMPAFIHNNSNLLYVLRNATANSTTWDSGPNLRHPMTMNLASGDVTFSGDVIAFSDIRLKKNIVTIDNALAKVETLRGVTFDHLEEGRGTGLIAQELQEVLPEAVRPAPGSEYLAVAYGNTVGLLVEAIKELSAQNKALMARLEALEAKE